MLTREDRIWACMVGGAIGDALGAAVEFMALEHIREEHGDAGLTDYAEIRGRVGLVTDDTQMTMFTAEGLLRARAAEAEDPVPFVYRAYLRWLHTQTRESLAPRFDDALDGWLIRIPALHQARAPGNTCLRALMGPSPGAIDPPLNDSKGCGGIMRIAPVGLLADDEARAFELGNRCCALTHGHPSGWLSGGYCAALIHALLRGEPPRAAVLRLRAELRAPQGDEVRAALDAAIAAAGSGAVPTPERVELLGEGWVAEEALAIAVYCLLVAEGFDHGVMLAVNHSGDSDSTGAIAGNLLGATLGRDAIASRWLAPLELRAEIEQLAADIEAVHAGAAPSADRYPPR